MAKFSANAESSIVSRSVSQFGADVLAIQVVERSYTNFALSMASIEPPINKFVSSRPPADATSPTALNTTSAPRANLLRNGIVLSATVKASPKSESPELISAATFPLETVFRSVKASGVNLAPEIIACSIALVIPVIPITFNSGPRYKVPASMITFTRSATSVGFKFVLVVVGTFADESGRVVEVTIDRAVLKVYEETVKAGSGQKDFSVVAYELERKNGLTR